MARSSTGFDREAYRADLADRLIRGAAFRGGHRERAQILQRLAHSDDHRDRALAARCSPDPSLLEGLAGDRHREVRGAAALNPRTPAALLAERATDRVALVRMAAATNPCTPRDALLTLASDPDVRVRRSVAGNSSASAEAFRILVEDADAVVHQRLGWNVAIPGAVALRLDAAGEFPILAITDGVVDLAAEELRELAGSDVDQFRYAAAEDPDTPADVLEVLADDDGAKPGRYIGHWIPIRSAVAANRSTPTPTVARLAGDPDPRVRASAADNPGCPVDVLRLLVDDDASIVRLSAVHNPRTPARSVWRLVDDPEVSVRQAIADQARFSRKLRERAVPPPALEPEPEVQPEPPRRRRAIQPPSPPPPPPPEPTPCDGETCARTLCVAGLHVGDDVLDDLWAVASASREGGYPGGGDTAELHEVGDDVYVCWSENGGWSALGRFATFDAAERAWRDAYGIDDWEDEDEDWDEDDEDDDYDSGDDED